MIKVIRNFKILSTLFLLLLFSCGQKKEGIRIAVASNFAPTLERIAIAFTKESGIPVTIIPGSTGKLFAQIRQGAPYDIFLSADQERPFLLEQQKLAGSRFTYAVGQLALWSKTLKFSDESILITAFKHLAIANPRLAPYGKAARDTLISLQLWDNVNHKIVIGENVSQSYQFAHSQNAELAFVSLSQVKAAEGSFWLVPQELYEPVKQDGCIIKDTENTQAFMAYLKTKAEKIILADGYLSTNVK
ncbi:MAG: molybdate ABC transporter substrate-binding protein [Lentisphaeraceae bacterium]|nr:molybdate ABC transporter substrate-binding protein [Lentisphaeraceae bacterium]